MSYRLPAEWEPQSGVLIAWPHAATDWAETLVEVETVYIAIVAAICRFETCVIVACDPENISLQLKTAGIPLDRIRLYAIPTNDTWARDFGPITVYDEKRPLLLDFGFNGWGLKFACDLDNQVTRRLHDNDAFGFVERKLINLILEGGSIESDGYGTVLTTSECLLNPNRNRHLTRDDIECKLQMFLGAKQVLWLENGYMIGDDTDSHIDTLARLCPGRTIVYQSCDDTSDEHFNDLAAMYEQLRTFKTVSGSTYRLLPLPWPRAQYDGEDRLPATYANFLVINDAVLVPTYNDPSDQQALKVINQAYPDREIIGINCLPLIRQHGSLHCITMQIPEGVSL
jgi:agmatine deiminase